MSVPRSKIHHTKSMSVHFPVESELSWLFSGLIIDTGLCFTVCCNQYKLSPGLSPFPFIFLKELVRVLVFVMRKGHKWGFPLWNFFSNCQRFVDLMTMLFHHSKYTACLPNQKRHKPTLTMFLKITMECGGGLWHRKMKAVQSAGWSELWACWLNC